jgi:UDP-N-acetylmuramate dehydrogenase
MSGELSTRLAQLKAALETLTGPVEVQVDQPLARHTAFRIGGPADLLAIAGSAEALRQVVLAAREHKVPYRVLGGGANVLVSDQGFRGLVVLNRARAVRFCAAGVVAESGTSFSTLAHKCVAQGLAGLEWAASIPGTVGGAVVGNAGAWGGDVASTLIQATILEPEGTVSRWPQERLEYAYRMSILKKQVAEAGSQAVVLEAEFALRPGDPRALGEQVARIAAQRRERQPRGATCGSVFKNPPGDHAGRLIEAAGLKGQRAGQAEISPVHANFIVNHGRATASDVMTLIEAAQDAVQAGYGISLELEIQRVGDWRDASTRPTSRESLGQGDDREQSAGLSDARC